MNDHHDERSVPPGVAPPFPAGWPVQPDTDVPPPPRRTFADVTLPITLLLITVFTTLWAGAYELRSDPLQGAWRFLAENPAALWNGVPFSATLLLILITHEFGHYICSRIHGVPASFPFFIPGPPHLIGTFGAIIRMRGPILRRKALFDIGVSGPIAGFVVAVVALTIGLQWSTVVLDVGRTELKLGPSLLLSGFISAFVPSIPYGHVIDLHPVAAAAWFGLFVTSLNLIPIGQLDGGHVAYAMWGRRQERVARLGIGVLLVLGLINLPYGNINWFVWAAIPALIGIGHPPVQDPEDGLGRGRIWIGWLAVAIFILTFSPIPFSIR